MTFKLCCQIHYVYICDFLESIFHYIHCRSPYPTNRHPDTLPAMSPLYVVGMLGLLMKISAPMCAPTEYTIYIERQECNYCVAVNTTICMGFCFSRVSRQCKDRKLDPRRDAPACSDKLILTKDDICHCLLTPCQTCDFRSSVEHKRDFSIPFHFILCSTE